MKQASLAQILKQIAAKTGAKIHYSVLPEEPLTATCAGVTIKQIMECLLGSRVDRIYRKLPKLPVITKSEAAIASNGIQPEEIWLLGSRYGNAANTMQCNARSTVVKKLGTVVTLMPSMIRTPIRPCYA